MRKGVAALPQVFLDPGAAAAVLPAPAADSHTQQRFKSSVSGFLRHTDPSMLDAKGSSSRAHVRRAVLEYAKENKLRFRASDPEWQSPCGTFAARLRPGDLFIRCDGELTALGLPAIILSNALDSYIESWALPPAKAPSC